MLKKVLLLLVQQAAKDHSQSWKSSSHQVWIKNAKNINRQHISFQIICQFKYFFNLFGLLYFPQVTMKRVTIWRCYTSRYVIVSHSAAAHGNLHHSAKGAQQSATCVEAVANRLQCCVRFVDLCLCLSASVVQCSGPTAQRHTRYSMIKEDF